MNTDPWEDPWIDTVTLTNGTTPQGAVLEPPDISGMPPDKGCATASTPMPWGKHKGQPIGQIPRSYMRWCLENADALAPELRRSFEWMCGLAVGSTKAKVDPDAKPWKAAPQCSKPEPEQPKAPPPPIAQIASLRGLVKAWYGKMSRKFHPDLGGSAEKQIVLNLCYKTLCEEIERWEGQR